MTQMCGVLDSSPSCFLPNVAVNLEISRLSKTETMAMEHIIAPKDCTTLGSMARVVGVSAHMVGSARFACPASIVLSV